MSALAPLIADTLVELLTSLRFWAGLAMILSVVPIAWHFVSGGGGSQPIIVGSPPGSQVNIVPILQVVELFMIFMLPFMVMKMLMSR